MRVVVFIEGDESRSIDAAYFQYPVGRAGIGRQRERNGKEQWEEERKESEPEPRTAEFTSWCVHSAASLPISTVWNGAD